MTLSYSHQDERLSQALRGMRGEPVEQLDRGMCRQEQSHITRPVGRRRTLGIWFGSLHLTLAYVLLSAILTFSAQAATTVVTAQDGQHHQRAGNGRLAQHDEEIIWDRSPPPRIPSVNLEKRQDLFVASLKASSASGKQTTSPSRRLSFDATATANPTSSSSGSSASATTSGSTSDPIVASLPKPFDGGFGTNYTQQTCPAFLKSFSTNQTFISCLPFSLLLQVSKSHGSMATPWANSARRTPYLSSTLPQMTTASSKRWTQPVQLISPCARQ